MTLIHRDIVAEIEGQLFDISLTIEGSVCRWREAHGEEFVSYNFTIGEVEFCYGNGQEVKDGRIKTQLWNFVNKWIDDEWEDLKLEIDE